MKVKMNSKIHIDLSRGILDVEGAEKFVKEIYDDFKNEVATSANFAVGKESDASGALEGETEIRKSRGTKKKPTKSPKKKAKKGVSKAHPYSPSVDNNLDINELPKFYAKFEPKNNRDRVVIFGKFLQQKSFPVFSADQIYTCFLVVDKKNLPKAFTQLLIDTKGISKYIKYESYDSIEITPIGEHHFHTKLDVDESA